MSKNSWKSCIRRRLLDYSLDQAVDYGLSLSPLQKPILLERFKDRSSLRQVLTSKVDFEIENPEDDDHIGRLAIESGPSLTKTFADIDRIKNIDCKLI